MWSLPLPIRGWRWFRPSRQPPSSAPSPLERTRFVDNAISRVYQAPDCQALPKPSNRVYFASPAEAERAGYLPHRACLGGAVIPPIHWGDTRTPSRMGDHHGMNRYLPWSLARTLRGSSGRVARPAVVSYHLGWHDVAEPERRDKALRASGIRMPRN